MIDDDIAQEESKEVVTSRTRAGFYRDLLLRLVFNIFIFSLLILIDYVLLKVVRWLLPENEWSSIVVEYTQIGVFLIAVIASISTLLALIYSVYKLQRTQRERILLKLQEKDEAFYKQIQEDVRYLLGERRPSNV